MKRYVHAARSSSRYEAPSDKGFNEYQLKQIEKGKQAGVDVNWYADPRFNSGQMEEIRKGLESGVDVSIYAHPRYDWRKMLNIREILESGFDINVYADPKKFNWQQLGEIKSGLKKGFDVSIYADPKFTWRQMREIVFGLRKGLDVSIYADPKFDGEQMLQIRLGLEDGLDVSIYADPKFTWKQMMAIRKYANDPLFKETSLDNIVKAYNKDLPSLEYLKYRKDELYWKKAKDTAASSQPIDILALEEEFDLAPLEGRAAYTLGVSFDENADGSITFTNSAGAEINTISSADFDNMVREAIANSSTRRGFAKAFAAQIKHALDL